MSCVKSLSEEILFLWRSSQRRIFITLSSSAVEVFPRSRWPKRIQQSLLSFFYTFADLKCFQLLVVTHDNDDDDQIMVIFLAAGWMSNDLVVKVLEDLIILGNSVSHLNPVYNRVSRRSVSNRPLKQDMLCAVLVIFHFFPFC